MAKQPSRFWVLVMLLLIISGLVLVGCGGDDDEGDDQEATEAPDEQAAPQVVGVLVSMNETTPFFITLVEGAQEAAGRLGVELVVNYADDDAELQSSQIEAFIEAGVSALLLNPVSEEVAAAVEAANEAGIPVFTFDRSAAGGDIVSHIASDNVAGGRMAADYLASAINRAGKVVELQGTPGASAAADRGAGFNEAISAYEDIEVIAQETGNFNADDGKAVFADILAENPEIDAVFAHNDDMILGAIEAAKEAGRADEIVFVGFDAIEAAIEAIENGDLAGTVAQRPGEIGRISVETVVDHLNGETVPAYVPVELSVITE